LVVVGERTRTSTRPTAKESGEESRKNGIE